MIRHSLRLIDIQHSGRLFKSNDINKDSDMSISLNVQDNLNLKK